MSRRDDEAMRALAEALARMIYETTHLSPEQDDGSHWCKISAEALNQSRAALAAFPRRLLSPPHRALPRSKERRDEP